MQLFGPDKNKLELLKNYKDYCIESVLSTGDETLSILHPAHLSKNIVEEGYIQNKTNEYVIKEIVTQGNWKRVKAKLNVEDLEGKVFESFETVAETITDCINLALAGTGWTVGTCNVTKRRTVRKTNSSSWDIIQEAKKVYRCELEFETLKKKINIYEKRGSDKGVYFIDTLNLKSLDVQSDSYDYYTRIIAKGKGDLKVTLENFQYSNKVKTYIWKDERYTDIDSLTEDATAKLNDLSKPYRSYKATIIDLANISKENYKNILSYSLGDIITLVSKENKIREKQRIVKIVEYPDEPDRNTCEMANTILTFEDIQKELQETSNTVNNITTDNGTIDGSSINGITTEQIYDFEASIGKITDLTIVNARIDELYATKANISELNAVVANVAELFATKATITELNALSATINTALIGKADITELNAINATIKVLEVDTATIKTLINGNLSSENIQAGGITSDKLTIANGFITNAMIASLDVSKINAGTISTNKFRIVSDNGGIEIVGATQQFKDRNNKVRIQMGQDAAGNFNFILRGEDGTTTLIDHTGIKEKAIADNLIKENMVAPDAIGEKQINYSSLITGLNKDTNTQLIKASKVAIDLTGQSLEVAFNSLKSNVDGLEIGGRNFLLNSKMNYLPSGGSGETTYKELIKDPNHGIVLHVKCLYIYQVDFLKMSLIPLVGEKYLVTFFAKSLNSSVLRCQINNGNTTFSNNINIKTSTKWGKCTAEFTIKNVPEGSPNFYFYPDNDEYWIKDIKIERSNKATDWSPAPEDVDSKIESNSTTINVMQGHINTAINNTQIVKDGQTILLKDDYNRTVSKVDSMNSTIGTHATKIDQLTGNITSVDTKVNSVQRDLEGTKSTVSSHTSQINGLNSTVSTQGSSINQLKNQIALKVEATDVTEAINNIKVGGRNYIIFNKVSSYVSYNTITSKSVGYIKSTWKESYENNLFTIKVDDFTPKKAVYTISGIIKVNGKIPANKYFTGYASTKGSGLLKNEYDSETGKFVITQTYSNSSDWIFHAPTTRVSGSSDIVELFNLKFEEGNKETDFTVAQEDIDSSIANVQTQVTTTNNKVATIETNLNSITNRVSSTESKVTTINGNITNITNRVTTAESKLTATSLTTTISSAISGGTSSISTTQFVMDKNGFTVKNGAIKIQNKAGTIVLQGDTNGNLKLAGSITCGATITGGLLKSTNGRLRFDLEAGSIAVYDDTTKTLQIGYNKIQGTNYTGASIGAEYNNYACLSNKITSSATTYQMMLTTVGKDIDTFKKGVNLGHTLHTQNWHIDMGTSSELQWRQSGAGYDSFITDGTDGMLRIYGDNGVYLGYRKSAENMYVIAIRESGSHTFPKATDINGYVLEVNAPINMQGQSIEDCSNIKTHDIEIIEPIAFYNSKDSDAKTRNLHVTKSTQNIIEFIGSVTVVDGEATVELPCDVVFKNYVVLLSPIGLNKNVVVTEKNDDNFKISGDDGIVDYVIKFETVSYSKYIKESLIPYNNIDIIKRNESDKPKLITSCC